MRTSRARQVEAITSSIRVLIVEDNQYLRKLVRNLLVNIGVKQIDEVEEALAVLEAIRITDPDIVMLEWELPLLSGNEVARIIRTPGLLTRPSVPIILFSKAASQARIEEAKRLGVDAYLTMPISAKALADRIVTILADPRPTAEAAGEAAQSTFII
jgi:two-component system, chemotaxis family, chemotaxis protein CheY